ncbi:MAG: RNA polymerase sigma factor [Candidatus Limimorpha sp.]
MKLYDLCCHTVFNASFRILLNTQDAEEVAQDSILKAFSSLEKFNGSQCEFIAYVRTIAINKSIDEIRKRNRQPSFVEIDNTADKVDDDDDVADDFPVEKIKEELEKLPDGYRLVITLHLLENMDFDDIAERLGIKPSTVRSQYVRGLERLRQSIKKVQLG